MVFFGWLLTMVLSGNAAMPTWIDLTHPFDEKTIYWPTEKGFERRKTEEVTPGGTFVAMAHFAAAEHGGTHMDAPFHMYRGRLTVDQVLLDQLVRPGVVVDVSASCVGNPDYEVRVEDLRAFEKRWGRIPDGAIVLVRTGFGKFWPDRRRYLGTDERGEAAEKKLHFPGLSPKAAQWLALQRNISAAGIDTASIDRGRSANFEAHVALFANNVPAFENVANLDQLPPRGFTVAAFPMKIGGGTGAPLRIAATLGSFSSAEPPKR